MADGLHMFEKALPLQSINYSFTEIFGQLYLKENNDSLGSSLSSSPFSSLSSISQHRRDSFSSTNSSTCTDELGFDSSDDIDQDLLKDYCHPTTKYQNKRHSKRNIGSFPPPISSIGRNGKPWVCFKSIREDGRFILTESRVPTQEFLHACRKNGRLKMQFVQSDDEFLDDDDEFLDDNEDGNTEITGHV